MSLLDITNLTAGYGALRILHDVDVAVDEGNITVILGANGAGKTTLLRAISGQIPARGSVRFDGDELVGSRKNPARRGVAHVPEGRGTFGALTVEDNLRVGAYHRPHEEAQESFEYWTEFFPRLSERIKQPAASLSGGEQQMLAIARALMSRPRLLLLDEPSLGLAPKVTQGLFEGLRKINEESGLTMLLVEQNAHLTLRIADDAIVMETGRTSAKRTAADLMADQSIQRAYLGI